MRKTGRLQPRGTHFVRLSTIGLVCGISLVLFAAAAAPPENLEALPHQLGEIRVTWTDVAGDEDGFVLERSTDQINWIQIADPNTLPADSSDYVDAVGTTRKKYAYRVASSHLGVLSTWSNTSTAVPLFTGMPLYGWLDVTDYGTCAISGVTNPHPIQCAISNDLGGKIAPGESTANGPHVVYFPDGQYDIDQTLFLEGRGGVQFVGESPGGAILKWTGGPGSSPDDTKVMFHAEGNRDSTWRNLVWDGGCGDPDNCFVVAFDQSFCGRTDTSIQRSPDCGPANLGWPESETLGESDIGAAHVDSVFKNAFVGLRLGHYGVADDTSTIRRCQFIDDFVGVSLEDDNALNHAFWDSLYQGNYVGITNDISGVRRVYDPAYAPGVCQGQSGAPACFYSSDCATGFSCVWTRRRRGDFEIYRGRFVGNAHTDIWADPAGEFTIRDSWATGSQRFFFAGGLNASTGRYTLLNNTVWDPAGLAIETATPGTFLFVDNAIYTDPAAVDAPVVLNSLTGFGHPDSGKIDLIAVDNVYTNANPYNFKKAFRLRELGTQTTSTPPPVSIPALPTVQEQLNGRPVYTVTDAATADPAANAARIQQVIDAAVADAQPAIVHLPGLDGRMEVNQTLHIPAGADLILTGDGKYTTLWWVGTPGLPILQIDGAQVNGLTIRDLQFLSGGIVVENLSQDNAHALLSQLRVAQSSAAGVVVQDLDTVKLNFPNYAGEHGLFVGPEAVGMLVQAGPTAVPAQDKPGLAVWSGTELKHKWDFSVINDQAGAKVLISGNYMESSEHHLRVQGGGSDGAVMVHGGKAASVVVLDDPSDPVEMADKTAVISIEDFPGNVSIAGSQFFVLPPAGAGSSSPEAADHGARIRVVGSQTANLDVEALGNTIRRQPSPVDPSDPALDAPEYDLFDALPNTVDFLRLSGKRAISSAYPLPDIFTDETDPQNPSAVGTLTPAQETQFLDGLSLLRTIPLPGFYDEFGASDPWQINFDRVFIYKGSPVGLVLSGGLSCSGPGDCVDAPSCTVDSCDQADLPANVPGQCRFVPEDSLCDDGDACTADSCDPMTDCSNVPLNCDDGQLCNGLETCDPLQGCQAGTPLDCDDGDACTTDSCDPFTGCLNDPLTCDDGLFCNGFETCDVGGGCQSGAPVDCDDLVACTTDSCNEATDACDHVPDDASCDNGLFCDGAETCDVTGDCQAASDPCPGQTCNETINACETDSRPRMEAGTVTVGATHVTVPLVNAYASPVVVCSVQYDANSAPVVTRVRNVTATSFDVRLQNPSSEAVSSENVNYFVVEEGVWTIDGLKIEAQRYLSTITDHKSSWVGEAQAYGQSYTSPVVLGQVMTENDPDWSVFWCHGSSRNSPPSSATLRTGKTVCEDFNTTRADETIGLIVLEAGTGAITGVGYQTALGGDSVKGIGDSPPYSYDFASSFSTPPEVAVVTMAAMDGKDGAWAQTHGATQATETTLVLSVDEDQVKDTDRKHTDEQVGYAVFETAFAFEEAPSCLVPADCDDGVFCNGPEDCAAGVCVAGTPVDCNDNVGCTTDSCNEFADTCDNTAVDAVCDNGLFCDGAETCDPLSDCQAGTPPTVDDGVSCTSDACDEGSNTITHTPNDAICDDGQFCNGAEVCDAVNDCQAGTAPACDDGVGCTTDSCDPAAAGGAGACAAAPDDAACDDGQFCNGAETCDAVNDCQAGTAPVCDDGVGCTTDSCDPAAAGGAGACAAAPDDANCDDGQFCNGAEVCDAVKDCQAGSEPVCDDGVACTIDSCDFAAAGGAGACEAAPDNASCDDGVFCNGAETCDALNDCQNGSDPCPGESCDEAGASCVACLIDEDCDDGAFCNGVETCSAGTCQAGTAPLCDDGVSCTTDSCDPAAAGGVGACTSTPDDAACDDGQFCNGAETCDAVNNCLAGTAPACNDGVGCTIDSCDPAAAGGAGACAASPDDAACGDGQFCNGAETCDAVNDCQAGSAPTCDDGVGCTMDSCDPAAAGGAGACAAAPDDATCDDGQFCNGTETCDAVNDCQTGTAPVCNDGVGCTTDSCDPAAAGGAGACAAAPDDSTCDDGLFCNGAETCDTINDCQTGTAPVCDDGVGCTTDSCDPAAAGGAGACATAPDDAACDDGLFCNGAETCDTVNDCQAASAPCPESCDEVSDTCVACLIDEDCDDGAFCNGVETCDAGTCQAGTAPVCNDGVGCTTDTCDPAAAGGAGACAAAPDDSTCDDGLFCNGAETCDAVNDCQAGSAPTCDDGVGCTMDFCDPAAAGGAGACAAAPDDATCDDGQFCNGTETCDAINDCQAGTAPACDDGVVCTTDSCDPLAAGGAGACAAAPDDAACDDAQLCNGAETCDAINDCQAGTAPVCDDGVGCTTDSCDPEAAGGAGACAAAPDDTECDDGLFCNGAETCDTVNDCQAASAPCPESCDEVSDTCVACLIDEDCNDGAFCNGVETCDAGTCKAGTAPVCNDGVGCTTDTCDPAAAGGAGACAAAPDDSTCDDGLFCNGAETCDAVNDCQAGSAPTCDDGVGCTMDSCDPAAAGGAGACAAAPDDSTCDDGQFCNGTETCDAINDCQAGTAPACDDGVVCTTDSCDPLAAGGAGACAAAPDDAACNDGQFCNGAETCDAINDCQAGTAPVCDDGVGCTTDSCDPEAAGGAGACAAAPDDTECDDGQFCNGAETCDAVNDCQAGTAPVCDDGVGCTTDSCDPAAASGLGACTVAPDDTSCNDGQFCNGTETCDAVNDCQAGIDPCPDESCDESGDACVACLIDADCDDGAFCNGVETCNAGSCQAGTAPVCDDGVACTTDSCDPAAAGGTGACAAAPVDAACDDGQFCNGAETCDAVNDCQAGTAPVCNDGVGCTVDSCDPLAAGGAGACAAAPNHATCDDSQFCNGVETCDAINDCQAGTAPVCNDEVGCTIDSCDPAAAGGAGACAAAPDDAACDDGQFCNGAETCDTVSDCQAGTAPACDDGVGCTIDSCDPAAAGGAGACGAAPNDALCDDGQFCNGAETCDAVTDCQAGSDPCPGESCDESGDACVACLIDEDCDDGAFCNGVETCNAGSCQAGTPPAVDDGVSCTLDACDEGSDSITHTPDNAICDDGTFCNGVETCDALTDCQAGTPVSCNDGVGCTTDACNETSNTCDQTPVDAACDNGLFCDGVETCDLLADCQPGSDPCPGQTCSESNDTCESGPAARLETGALLVGGTPVTVSLANTYVSPVVVCSVQYSNNTTPIVTRVSNVTATGFDVRLQNPSNGAVAMDSVSYIVVEEGVWTFDGVAVEAQTYASTVTDANNAWGGQAQAYGGGYSSPVVLGQVMSENDPNWSVFWCQGGTRKSPPSASTLLTGKTVCEDGNTTRAEETIGFIVIEAGSGTIGGVAFEAALGADTIRGADNSPPYSYSFAGSFSSAPTIAIHTMAGVDGGNGGWSLSHGSTLATATTLFLSIDEDQVNDPERNHTTEQVGYLVFEAPVVYP